MKPTGSPTKTMLAIVLGALVFFFIFEKRWMLYIALGAAAAGVLFPWLAEKVEWLWEKIAFVLGYVNSRILLSIIFFLIVTPIAFFMRLGGKGNIVLRGGKTSYFTDRDHRYEASDLENPW